MPRQFSLDKKAFLFDRMLSNPDWNPQINRNAIYSDKEIDSIRAKWILEEIKRRKAIQPAMTVAEFIKKYNLQTIPLRTVYYILDTTTSNRKKKGHTGSLNQLIRKNKGRYLKVVREIRMIEKDYEVNVNKDKSHFHYCVDGRVKRYTNYSKFKSPKTSEDGKIHLVLEIIENKKENPLLARFRFNDYNECNAFLMGFATGLRTGEARTLRQWEVDALKQFKKRNKENDNNQ